MLRSLTIAIAQLHPHKGDYRANLTRLRDIFAQVRMLSPHPQVLHFPETVLSGYFVEGGVRPDPPRPPQELPADIRAV